MTFLHPSRGTQGRAEILSGTSSSWMRIQSGISSSEGRRTLQVRVTPDDGQPAFESVLRTNDQLNPGEVTYVKYNPRRPANCSLDWPRLNAEFGKHKFGQACRRPVLPIEDQAGVSGLDHGTPALAASSMHVSDGRRVHIVNGSVAFTGGTQPATSDVADELAKLADLKTKGLLTNAEFTSAKAKLLGR